MFSRIEHDLKRRQRRQRIERQQKPVDPWPLEQQGAAATAERVQRALTDFEYFERTYFPPEMYRNYAVPGAFHRQLDAIDDTPGVHIVAGARNMGKTKRIEKRMAWRFLTQRMAMGFAYSSDTTKAADLLDNVQMLLENPRVVHDFGVVFEVENEREFAFRTTLFRHTCYAGAFSERRSLRGWSKGTNRASWGFGDDIETESVNCSLSTAAVQSRIRRLADTYQSMIAEEKTFIICGNNFDTRCYINVLLNEQKAGILSDDWYVHVFPAWSDDTGSLWPERFPAASEAEMMRMLQAFDMRDWMGNFQQQPTEADGEVFNRSHYNEWTELPTDLIGVCWCDPNLSKLGKGDKSALGAMCWSPSSQRFYITNATLRSYSESVMLLSDYFCLKRPHIPYMGFDGNVTQESTWTDHVRNWQRIKGLPYTPLHYKRYHVDQLAKNARLLWEEDRILWPPGFAATEMGREFMEQVYAFTSKSAGRPDDAPDWLISIIEFIHEIGIAGRIPYTAGDIESVADYYAF